MNIHDFGIQVRAARKSLRMSQEEVAQEVGISQSHLSRLENGKLPMDPYVWEKLQEILRMTPGVKAPERNLPAPSHVWRTASPRPTRSETRSFGTRINTARRTFGHAIEELYGAIKKRDDADLCQQFLEQAGMESSLECWMWLQLLAAGGQPRAWSVSKAGFRAHRLIDPKTRLNTTDIPWPCLELLLNRYQCLLFPQVTVDVRCAIYRLDALVCVRLPHRPRFWVNLEVDGQGHDARFDADRQRLLGLPTLRLKTSDLAGGGAGEVLELKLATLLKRMRGAA